MQNEEDYLDGLLNSISKAKTEVNHAAKQKQQDIEERIALRNRVKPDDDFMEVNGLSGFRPRTVKRENLKKALTEADFLHDFEDELANGEPDEFIDQFEREIDDEERQYEKENELLEDEEEKKLQILKSRKTSDDISEESEAEAGEAITTGNKETTGNEESLLDIEPEEGVTEDTEEPLSFENENKAEETENLLNNIKGILNDSDKEETTSKEEPENGLLQKEFQPDELDSSMETEKTETPVAVSDEDMTAADSSMAGEAEKKEETGPTLLDENSDAVDLMSLLSSNEDGELSDIENLLTADTDNAELTDARESFEQAANESQNAGKETSEPEDVSETAISFEGETVEKKKTGLFAKIAAFFKAILEDDEENEDEIVKIAENTAPEDTNAENQEILKQFAESEQKGTAPAGKKEKKKKEKKPKKPKEKKEKKPGFLAKMKEKKENQPPDTSPVIPMKPLIFLLVFAVSVILLVIVGGKVIYGMQTKQTAKTAYNSGNYVTAFGVLNGSKEASEDSTFYQKVSLLANLQSSSQQYDSFMKIKAYDMALDELIIGYGRYDENAADAKKLNIEDAYNTLGSSLAQQLQTQFGVSEKEAVKLYKMDDRSEYTKEIDGILTNLGMTDGQ